MPGKESATNEQIADAVEALIKAFYKKGKLKMAQIQNVIGDVMDADDMIKHLTDLKGIFELAGASRGNYELTAKGMETAMYLAMQDFYRTTGNTTITEEELMNYARRKW